MKDGRGGSIKFNVSKKAQLTIYVLLAIVIVVFVIVYFLTDSNEGVIYQNDGSEAILDSLINCLEFTSKSSLYLITYQGGYNSPPNESFSFSPTFFPYYYFDGDILLPHVDSFETEMSQYIEENLASCFEEVDDGGFSISYGSPFVETDILDEGVVFTIDMPVLLIKGDKNRIIELSEYPVYYESSLLDMLKVAKFYVEELDEDSQFYCISCISEMTGDYGLNFYIFHALEDVDLVMIFEKAEEPLILNFMTKTQREELDYEY